MHFVDHQLIISQFISDHQTTERPCGFCWSSHWETLQEPRWYVMQGRVMKVSELHALNSYFKYIAFLTYCGLYPSMAARVHFSHLYFFRLASWWEASWSGGTSQFWCEQSSWGNFGCPVCLKTSRNITGALVLIRCCCSPWGRCTMLPAWGKYYLFYVGIIYLILHMSPLEKLYQVYCF